MTALITVSIYFAGVVFFLALAGTNRRRARRLGGEENG